MAHNSWFRNWGKVFGGICDLPGHHERREGIRDPPTRSVTQTWECHLVKCHWICGFNIPLEEAGDCQSTWHQLSSLHCQGAPENSNETCRKSDTDMRGTTERNTQEKGGERRREKKDVMKWEMP